MAYEPSRGAIIARGGGPGSSMRTWMGNKRPPGRRRLSPKDTGFQADALSGTRRRVTQRIRDRRANRIRAARAGGAGPGFAAAQSIGSGG